MKVDALLVDLRLAAERGLEWLDRETVAHVAAVTAALTYSVIDDDPHVGAFHGAPLASAPQFSGTRLVVNKDRHAIDGGQLLLHCDDLGPIGDRYACRQFCAPIAGDVFRSNRDLSYAVSQQDCGQLRYTDR